MQILCFVSELENLMSKNVTDIGSFLGKLRYTSFLSIAMNTYAFFSIDEIDTVGLEDLSNVDLALDNPMSSQTDFFYVFFSGLILILMLPIFRFALQGNPLLTLNGYMTQISSCQAIVMKHMIFKRIHYIAIKAELTGDVLEVLTTTRSILRLNRKINGIFFLRITNVIGDGLLMFLKCLSALWIVYGLHKEMECLEYYSPVFTLLMRGHIITRVARHYGKGLKSYELLGTSSNSKIMPQCRRDLSIYPCTTIS
ncbi:hypothetical protein J6590_081915 [Homalodisca vitripennis]|nr:hypothetical protein J6590_081915 [Homalodisca vitripennis]